MSAPLTQDEYLADSNQCPYCQSNNIEGDRVEVDSYGAWQTVLCNACGRAWNDVYKLMGWEPTDN